MAWAAVPGAEGFSTTWACTASPHCSLGMPITATCSTAECDATAFSTSVEYTFSPPVTITSFTRLWMSGRGLWTGAICNP